jgi:hypothetical protein
LLNDAFAMAIPDLNSRVHLVSFVIMLRKHLKCSIFSDFFICPSLHWGQLPWDSQCTDRRSDSFFVCLSLHSVHSQNAAPFTLKSDLPNHPVLLPCWMLCAKFMYTKSPGYVSVQNSIHETHCMKEKPCSKVISSSISQETLRILFNFVVHIMSTRARNLSLPWATLVQSKPSSLTSILMLSSSYTLYLQYSLECLYIM